MTELGERIIVLIDMDCFFCQVEAKLAPELKGKPLAVIQYSSFGPGSIIAVNYEARDFGVTRHMRGDEAKEKCSGIQLVTVPPLRNKPDTGRYRAAGKEVIDVLKKHCATIERASVDEAYLDITDLVDKKMSEMLSPPENLLSKLSNTYVVGYCDNDTNNEQTRTEGIERWLEESFGDLGDIQSRRLAIGGLIVEHLRSEIYTHCEYRCSAGISYNKILAKLACGLHKPNKQTILPGSAVPGLYSSLPVKKVRNLGGKFGNIVMESLGCNVMADLLRYTLQDLQKRFDEKTGIWLYNIARGIDSEPVTSRLVCKSIGASKNFPGKQAITKIDVLEHWANELSMEIVDRLEQDLEENERRATSLTVSFQYYQDRKVISQSKACALSSYKFEKICNLCVDVITKATKKPIAFIGMSAGKFVPVKGSASFENFFKAGPSSTLNVCIKKTDTTVTKDNKNSEKSEMKSKVNESNEFFKKSNKLSDDILKSQREKRLSSDENRKDENEPKVDISPDRKISLLSNTDLRKTLNGDNFKNSFFMNFLKDSKSSSSSKDPAKVQNEMIEKNNQKNDEKEDELNDSSSAQISPDVFDDDEKSQEISEKTQVIKKDEKKHEENSRDNVLTQLKEIFPDLDNIDRSVMELLPIELQREANAYLKTKKMETIKVVKKLESPKSTKINGKNSTIKLRVKPKAAVKTNSIYNFFVKNSPDSNDLEMKQCPECGQMIRFEKLGEHSDFHVAQNLSRAINQSSSNENNNSDELSSPSVKRKISNIDNLKTNKKARNIESFFT